MNKQFQAYLALKAELDSYVWKDTQTEDMRAQALATLLKLKSFLGSFKSERRLRHLPVEEGTVIFLLAKIKKELLNGNYWNGCHELTDIFYYDFIRQKRTADMLMKLLQNI